MINKVIKLDAFRVNIEKAIIHDSSQQIFTRELFCAKQNWRLCMMEIENR